MKNIFFQFSAVLSIFLFSIFSKSADTPYDSFFWLEDVSGEKPMEWVNKQNAKSVAQLQQSAEYKNIETELTDILLAKDRVPMAGSARGYFWNFWQDEIHVHGILRRTTLEEYRKPDPQWEVILDFDQLSKQEGENWVYKGSKILHPTSQRLVFELSRGGKDAVVVREFDLTTKQFVKDGFNLPESKTRFTPIDENQVIVGTDFGNDSMTESGYPRTLKLWKRGEPLTSAKTLFVGEKTDVSVGAFIIKEKKLNHVILTRSLDFFHFENYLLKNDGTLLKFPFPSSANLQGLSSDFIYYQLKEPLSLKERTLSSGSIVRLNIHESDLEKVEIVFTPEKGQSIENITVNSAEIFITLLNNVRNQTLRLAKDSQGGWVSTLLPFPSNGVFSFDPKDESDPKDLSTLTYQDFLTPPSQYLVHDEDGSFSLELLKKSPDRFDSTSYKVSQEFSTSKDGTKIPFFLIQRKGTPLNRKNPTLLYGYGGFEISKTPWYLSKIGKVWLDRGGVFVVANIRGGGEFGPEWHQAALKGNRQKAFDDFISVAEELIQRKITSPRHLGIQGGSNGGLLTGTVMIQRPELFNASLIQVPLLDMLRYSKLLAGASWVGEYGNPEVPNECASLLAYSPYHNVTPSKKYPVPLFTTSTKDDRVHPGHARKMAARMIEQGHEIFYYENINGGHGGSADLNEAIKMNALEFTYLWERLK